jgi:hypothetical protein
MKRKGQMKLSFGMIFSIFLIIIFLAFAVYAIIKFINMQHLIQTETFKNDLETHINSIWGSSGCGSYPKEYYLPKKINAVCFDEDSYMYFEERGIFEGKTIEHVEVDGFCIPNIEGKVKMTLVKDCGEILVKITQ